MTERRGSRLNKKAPKQKPKPKPKRPKPPENAFAFVLAAARRRKRLTCSEMARLYGAAPTVITRIESGRCAIGEATIRRYAKALGMRVQLKLLRGVR